MSHYDRNNKFIGTSRVETSASGESILQGTAGLGDLIAAYSASILYQDPQIYSQYESLRAAQERCFQQNDEKACREIKFHLGELAALIDKRG